MVAVDRDGRGVAKTGRSGFERMAMGESRSPEEIAVSLDVADPEDVEGDI